MLKIFCCAQYFSRSSAIYPNSKTLPMDGFPYNLARVVGRFEIFTLIRGSKLRLFGFGNKIFIIRKAIVKRGIIIWSEFRSINDSILQNWGACVDTVFGMSQDG